MRYPNMLVTMAQELRSSIEYSETNPYFAFCKFPFSRFLFYKNSSSTKLALAILFSLGVAMVSACNTIAGAYSDDPYGPVVNCDSTLQMDELLQCVDKKYALMDALHESPRVKDDKQFRSWDKKDYTLLPTNYRKVNDFKSIKPCYKKDKCQFYSTSSSDVTKFAVYDEYDGRKIRVDNKARNIGGGIYLNKDNPVGLSNVWFSSFVGTPSKYIRSYKNPYKDIILAKQNDQAYLYVPLIENIKLKDDKSLIVANIERFCPPTLKNKDPIASKEVYLSTKFEACGIYRFYYVTKKVKGNIPVLISLDKRVNPSKIYLKIGDDIFEIDINNQHDAIFFLEKNSVLKNSAQYPELNNILMQNKKGDYNEK